MQKKTKTIFYLLAALLFSNKICAQLPNCSHRIAYILTDEGSIYNYDVDQLVVAGINPVLNTIHLPPDSYGLAVSTNLNAAAPAVTFYTAAPSNGFFRFFYYDGSTWVNTNHIAGGGSNFGAGGGYIFDLTGDEVWRYDGTGNATLLVNIGSQPRVYDLSVDCSGNFYVLNALSPQSLKKYNSSGILINSYSVSGFTYDSSIPSLAGLVVFGNDVYYDSPNFTHGTFNGDTVNFTEGPLLPLPASIYDMANCQGIPTPTQVFVTVCSNQLPYNWNGNNYAAAGIYLITLPASTGCDSLVTLNLSAGTITGTPQNVSVCQNQLPYTWNGNSYPTTGTYTVTLISSGGCDSIATLNLIMATTITGIPQYINVCQNQLPYVWNGNNYNTVGTYSITLMSSGGCDSIATLDLSIATTITGIPQYINVCQNQLPYVWNGNNYTTVGTYSITLTSSGGCDSIATLHLGLANLITGMPQNVSVCQNQLPYVWNGNNYSTAGNYTATLTAGNGCDSIATLNLGIKPVTTGFPQNMSVCENQLPYSWNGNDYNTAGNYTATLTGSNGCDSIATLNLYIKQNSSTIIDTSICPDQLPYYWNGNQYTMAGTEQAIFTAANGCDSIVTVNLSLYPSAIAFAGNDDSAEYNVPYQLSGSGGTAYEWSPAAVLNNAHIANPLAIINSNTTFYLNIKDNNGCIGYDTVNIKMPSRYPVFVPSAFSPNGDILNDVFRPILIDIKQLNYFRIYNRYGQMVFQANDISTGWDGTYKGAKQDIGTYTWILEAVDIKGKVWKQQGTVVLLR